MLAEMALFVFYGHRLLSKETRRIFGRRSDKKVQGLPAMEGNETGNDGISCGVGTLRGVIFRVVVTRRIIKALFFRGPFFQIAKVFKALQVSW